ncbi:Rhodanese-related sulfurtransferase [Williamwhitmania taraxaci]|uniref:Rhodanese-related sulfurtransferase n=2 Tax=Williamwhitmania taraxaci TaxID=1640674 RepID=A0A1G6RFE8_9BACT|nr:Rhodanese-related sulfurtransferase [Williamwhitmania taraxaci]
MLNTKTMTALNETPKNQTFTLKGVSHIEPEHANNLLQSGKAILLDVREQEELDIICFDIPKLIHIPISEIVEGHKQLSKETLIIVSSNSGTRGTKIANLLLYQGFKQVANLDGGIATWNKEKLSVFINGKKPSSGGCGCGCSH